ncbi:MAG: rhombosortase [Gammaproteobacteria bacterium]|nr:rhombosortase [Gammaproteobacteria bacterium]
MLTNNKNLVSIVPPWMRPALGLTVLMALIQALPEDWQGWIIYARIEVAEGQVWRLLSGNFIHLGWGHLFLNVAGLLAMAILFAQDRRTLQWAADLVICSIATSLGLYVLNPEIFWCVGLSGVLHGLFVIGAMGWVVSGISLGKWLLLGIGLKLLWEQSMGEMPFSGDIVGGAVVTDAHLWGALSGLMIFGVFELWRRSRAPV